MLLFSCSILLRPSLVESLKLAVRMSNSATRLELSRRTRSLFYSDLICNEMLPMRSVNFSLIRAALVLCLWSRSESKALLLFLIVFSCSVSSLRLVNLWNKVPILVDFLTRSKEFFCESKELASCIKS